ncbi:hypothetical protein H5T58_03325, partial [Candidatus Parcubacteria bacterium]|nr:hypothetical protein [Candidatus Parcubacteria bacterium]
MKLLIEILPQYINLLSLIFPWLWLWRALKSIFFWIHLWQLKEYHLGRFACHFQTHKGKSIFKRPLLWLKISALILAFYFSHFSFFIFLTLFFLYLVEGFVFFARILQRKLILPHLTFKAIFLILVNIIFFSFIAWYFAFDFKILVLWDIGDFSAISTLILIFQPISFFFRKRKINLAIQKRKLFKNLLAIGITGSFGKTSTKEFLSTILETKYGKDRVLKTPEHQNSEIAISNLLINELNLTHLFLVCEMGAYNKGGISLLAKMVKPKIGIVCGVNEQHLSLFGSLSNLLSAEGGKELLESLPEDGILIYNGEDQVLCKIYDNLPKERKRIVGIEKKEFDLSAFNIKIEKTKLSFFALSRSDGEVAKFEVNLIGAQNIINLLLAACCAKELGIDLAESAVAFHNLKPQQGGIVFSKTPRLFNVLD